jgi:2'-5' RNA ligase
MTILAITAPFEKAALNARARIQEIVEKSADKLQFTHFISLPLYDKNIKERVQLFNKELQGMDQTILVQPEKLHFTICMLKLYGNDALERAKLHLGSLQRQIYDLVGTRSTVVKLRGLKIMNDDPKNAHVVYTEPTQDTMQKVQELAGTANHLSGLYKQSGPYGNRSNISNFCRFSLRFVFEGRYREQNRTHSQASLHIDQHFL